MFDVTLLAENPPVNGVSIGTLITAAIGAFGAMGGAIGLLWKVFKDQTEKTEKRLTEKLDATEAERKKAHDQLLELSTEVGELRGTLTGYQESRTDNVSKLTRAVLDLVATTKEDTEK